MSPKRKETESGSTSNQPTEKARVRIDSEELPEQSQWGKNDVKESDNSISPMGHELISKSQHDPVKTISIDWFRVAMPIDIPKIAWACEVIPFLRKQFKDYLDKIRSTEGVASEVVDDGGSNSDIVAASSRDYEHVGA
ncbi:hypothetical protein FXO38_13733 [Capsicum annuum]|nr:hypothetical protein FXO38_13733 [Capsicum annuum]KAF3680880.1 hypothetical protein FXO37_03113 [Capsicum annuum]